MNIKKLNIFIKICKKIHVENMEQLTYFKGNTNKETIKNLLINYIFCE